MFCPQCGYSNAAVSAFCERCGAQIKAAPPPVPPAPPPMPWNPAMYPMPVSPPLPPAQARALAGLGDRFLAVLLDTFLIAAVFAVSGMWAATRWGGLTPTGFSLEGTPALIAISITMVAGFVYYWLCEGLFGRTLGKAVMGISVQQKDGRTCTLTASLVRNLLRVADGFAVYLVGFLVALLSKSRQRLGDMVAETLVVQVPTGGALRGSLVFAWMVLWVGGFTGAYLLHRAAPRSMEMASTTTSEISSRRTGDLAFTNFAFVESKGGPQRAAAPYKPGDTVYLKYEVNGFTTDKDGKIDVLLELEARDPNGLSMYPVWRKELIQRVPAGEPVTGSFNLDLPVFAPPGQYKIDLKAGDKVKNTTAELSPTFQMEAAGLDPAASLELRDFFLSLSRDGTPEEKPALQGGGTVYAKWKVFGLEAEQDTVNMRVALKVLGPSRKTVVDEPKYVVVNQSFYYRPPTFCLPMTGHITLPGSFTKGTYTAQYTVVDEIAKNEIQHQAQFELR